MITFKSNSFPVIPYEDDELNPGILGKSVSQWVESILKNTSYPITEVIPEDFGYCLMIKRKPYWLWVGVSGTSSYDFPENGLSEEITNDFPLESIKWSVWVRTEAGFLSRLLKKDNRKEESKEVFSLISTALKQQEITRLD